MKITSFLIVALLASASAMGATPSPSQCRAGETTYFNCEIRGDKLVSLCGKHDGAASYLQYRAGAFGAPPEVTYPATRGGQEMKEAFFFNNRQDSSHADTGVWFRRGNTYYELQYARDLSSVGGVSSPASQVLIWLGTPKGAPRPLVCKQSKGGAALSDAKDVIEAVSPRGRKWQLSPLDLHYLPKTKRSEPVKPVEEPNPAPALEAEPSAEPEQSEEKEEPTE